MLYYERNLPHWQPETRDLFLTWRLYGSLPQPVLNALRTRNFPSPGRKFIAFEDNLDLAAFGPTWLRTPEIAQPWFKLFSTLNNANSAGFTLTSSCRITYTSCLNRSRK